MVAALRPRDPRFWVLVLIAAGLVAQMRPAGAAVLGWRLEARVCLGVRCHLVPTRGTILGKATCLALLEPAAVRLASMSSRTLGLGDPRSAVRVVCVPVLGDLEA